MANKIRSIELENGVIVTFTSGLMISLEDGENDKIISIHYSDLEAIRDTVRQNSKSNGIETVNKEKVTS